MILLGTKQQLPAKMLPRSACDFDCVVEDGVVKERKRRKVNCSQDDVLRMQYEYNVFR